MAFLTNLKLTSAQKPIQSSSVQVRRIKLANRLDEQLALAKALQAGSQYVATRLRSITNKETGLRTQVEITKRVRQWWFVADNGKVALSVRYGARLLELAKGKFAVEVGSDKELINALDVIKAAVLGGELDLQIEAASSKLRAGFGK